MLLFNISIYGIFYMSKRILIFKFTFFICIYFICFVTTCFSQDIRASSANYESSSSQGSTNDDPYVPVLNPVTKKELEEIQIKNMMLVRAASPLYTVPKGSKSLLNLMPYLGSQRDQGACGNCFVWSSTAALEIQHNAFKNVNERLSIQYFNSNYGYPNYGSISACDGAFSPYAFTSFYSQDKKLIPWSNTNADYKDIFGFKTCKKSDNTTYKCPNIEPGLISTDPYYEIPSLGLQTIDLYSNTNSEIVNTIKYYIEQSIPVVFDFCFQDYNKFINFWNYSNENTIYDLTNISQSSNDIAYCHSTIITGYNDSSLVGNDSYLEVLNSWGTSSKRPHGVFRINMNVDFKKAVDSMNIIQGLYILNPNFQTLHSEGNGSVTINIFDSYSNPVSDELVFFNNEQYTTDRNGTITIPNIKDGSKFNISVTSKGSSYNARTNETECYEYKTSSYKGTFNFKNNKSATFTFIRNIFTTNDLNVANQVAVRFEDKNGNQINDVTINFNGNIYQSKTYNYQYKLPYVTSDQSFSLTYSKDNYIFEPMKIEDSPKRDCQGGYTTYKVKGYDITDDSISIADFELDDEEMQEGTNTKDGVITVKVEDILESGVKDVYVVFNNSKVYTTNMFGYVYISQVDINKAFKINLYRDGYLFDIDSYEDILTKNRKKLSLSFIMYADNAYRNCKEVSLDLKKLKSNVKKMFKLAKIAPKNERKQANKQQKKVNKLINKLPITAMICKTNKKSASKYHVVSYVYTKEQLLKNISKLQKQIKKLNKNYQNTYGKDKNWLKLRLSTLKKCTKELKNKINLIPNNIYYVVK